MRAMDSFIISAYTSANFKLEFLVSTFVFSIFLDESRLAAVRQAYQRINVSERFEKECHGAYESGVTMSCDKQSGKTILDETKRKEERSGEKRKLM
jgi:hypothetical protein